jgi:hypothetical protein
MLDRILPRSCRVLWTFAAEDRLTVSPRKVWL